MTFPTKADKALSNNQKHEIKKWSWESTRNYTFRYDAYTDIDVPEGEEEVENIKEAIEKEHLDYLLLKTEES